MPDQWIEIWCVLGRLLQSNGPHLWAMHQQGILFPALLTHSQRSFKVCMYMSADISKWNIICHLYGTNAFFQMCTVVCALTLEVFGGGLEGLHLGHTNAEEHKIETDAYRYFSASRIAMVEQVLPLQLERPKKFKQYYYVWQSTLSTYYCHFAHSPSQSQLLASRSPP